MDYPLLRQFDNAVRKYYLRLREIQVMEKLGRGKVAGADTPSRRALYGERIRWVGELVSELEQVEVPTPDAHSCRDYFLAAGQALQSAYGVFPADPESARRSLREYSYFLAAAQEELKKLWAQYHEQKN